MLLMDRRCECVRGVGGSSSQNRRSFHITVLSESSWFVILFALGSEAQSFRSMQYPTTNIAFAPENCKLSPERRARCCLLATHPVSFFKIGRRRSEVYLLPHCELRLEIRHNGLPLFFLYHPPLSTPAGSNKNREPLTL